MKIIKAEILFFCPDSMVEEIVNSVDVFTDSFDCPLHCEVFGTEMQEG